jgi:hypothetical protein
LIGCVAATLFSQVSIGPVELAKYSGNGLGGSGSLAQTVPQPIAPTALVNSKKNVVTVSWSTTTLSGGTPVPGYIVSRYTAAGAPVSINAGCTGTITTTSCVENNVPNGQWRYTVRAVAGSWSGPDSALSAIVTVAVPGLVISNPTITGPLPALLSGTISNFVAGESLSFHLDSATGTPLSGSPSTVPAGGNGSVSVTIPAGTNDAPHSVFAVGGTGSIASAAIDIVSQPHLVSLTMWDKNGNGKIDEVDATFDDTLAPYSAGIAPWTLANVPSGGTLQSVSVSGTVATLTIAEGTGPASTAPGSFTIALSANSAGIRDINNHTSSFSATAVTDKAAPVPVSLVLQDTDTNGKVDHVAITFSETLSAYSAGTAPWTLANVPSGGTLSSVSVTGATATLTLAEGAGPIDTSRGSMTVALASNASGIRDAASNLSSFAATAVTDGAVPIVTSITDTDGATDGKIEPGDTLAITFSEPLDPATVPSSTTLTLGDPRGSGMDYLDLTGVTQGPRPTGSNFYIVRNKDVAIFTSSVALSNGNKTITVTVGPTCTGDGCTEIGTVTTTPTLSWLTASTITDPAGNVPTVTFTQAIRLF